MKKLDEKNKAKALAMIARKDSYDDIIQSLEEDGVTISKSTLTQLKKNNSEAINKIESAIVEHEIADAKALHSKSTKILHRKLEKAEKWENDYAALREKLIAGELTQEDYDRAMSDMEKMDTKDALAINKEAFAQLKGNEDPDERRGSDEIEKLRKAIQDGDEVTLERIVFNG